MAQIRPMVDGDVPGVVAAWLSAMADLQARLGLPRTEPAQGDRDRLARRVRHLLRTDPAGSWVAEQGGRVVGLAQSFVRESYWVLSLLGVDPTAQTAGVGRELLERASDHGAGCRGTIQASSDPRAVGLYAAAGFAFHPTMEARGPIRPAPTVPKGVRVGDAHDLPLVGAIDREVRGSARPADIRFLLTTDEATLLLDGDRAYAVVKYDRLVTVAGRDEASAARVLRAALAKVHPGQPFAVAWLTGPQQWAIAPLVAAGLSLRPRGPVMIRGMDTPPANYLPSGGFG